MSLYEFLSLIFNFILIVIGGFTIWVVINISKQQKKDAELLQQNQKLEIDKRRKRDICPELTDYGGITIGYNEHTNRFKKMFVFAREVRACNVELKGNDDLIINTVVFNSQNQFWILTIEIESNTKPPLNEIKYNIELTFQDIDRNEYKAVAICDGIHAIIKGVAL
jgi:hypothetical protein